MKTKERRNDFLQVRTHQLVVQYQGVIPENINSGINIQTQQAIFNNICVYA